MKPVLIVDDDAPTQELLVALMRRSGFSSATASNGGEAIDAIRKTDFAAIILDLMMPAVDGQAVIDFVSREKDNIPVIVCTAAGPQKTQAIHDRVVKAIVRKPFDIEQLTQIVSSLVRPNETA